MSYFHESEPGGIYMKVFGDTTWIEIDEAVRHIRDHSNFSQMSYVIADFLEVGTFYISNYKHLLRASQDYEMAKANRNLKVALVGSRSDVKEAFEVWANSPMLKTQLNTKVFSNLDDARIWVSQPGGVQSEPAT